jgi:hypothetical protein
VRAGLVWLTVVIHAVALRALASAQEPPAVEPPAVEPPAVEPPAVEPAPPDDGTVEAQPDDRAWQLYHQAFSQLASGDLEGARATLSTLRRDFPDHPATARATEVRRVLDVTEGMPPPRPRRDPEAPSQLARAELALVQTLAGVYVGVDICLIADCDSAGSYIGLVVLGASVPLGVVIATTKGGIRPGTRAALNAGSLWGIWNGAMAVAIREEGDGGDGISAQSVGAVLLASHALGLGLGALIASTLRPTQGQVALADTVGIWAGVLSLYAHEAFAPDSDNLLETLLAASDAGLVVGALLARFFPMSRGRTLLIDAGGLVGLFFGMGTAVLIGGDDLDEQVLFGSGFAGATVGLAAGTWLTRSWDAPSVPARVTIVPVRGGAMLGVSMDL